MSETPKKIKAHGHIVQVDWAQTDPLKMDYIHNKPDFVDKSYVDNTFIKASSEETIVFDCGDAAEFIGEADQ